MEVEQEDKLAGGTLKDKPVLESDDDGELSDEECTSDEEILEGPKSASYWWDSGDDLSDNDDGDDDGNDEDYTPHLSKKQRSTKPCDMLEVKFGQKHIIKGETYERD